MLDNLKLKLAKWLDPALKEVIERRAKELSPMIRPNVYDLEYYNVPERPESGLTNQETKEMMVWAKQIVVSPYFKRFIQWGINCRVEWMIKEGKTERAIDFARSNIEDFALLEKELIRLSELFDEANKEPESFDRHDTGITSME